MKTLLRTAMVAIAVAFAGASAASADEDIGVVFMHGKWGTNGPKSPTAALLGKIQSAGFKLQAPDMPWSRERAYDKDVEGALLEIDAAVEKLRAAGAKRIVVGGQSLGANAALIYASHRDGLAGVMAISPGHTPDFGAFRDAVAQDVGQAKSLVDAGKGSEKRSFLDLNQGQKKQLTVPAAVYLSWMDPNGLAVIPKSAAALKPGTPLLWLVGEHDPMAQQGPGYAFNKAPPNPKNAYIVAKGGHFDANEQAAPQIIDWLKKL
jgi:pimeloyl-ACP methyl ester carboxylesterase